VDGSCPFDLEMILRFLYLLHLQEVLTDIYLYSPLLFFSSLSPLRFLPRVSRLRPFLTFFRRIAKFAPPPLFLSPCVNGLCLFLSLFLSPFSMKSYFPFLLAAKSCVLPSPFFASSLKRCSFPSLWPVFPPSSFVINSTQVLPFFFSLANSFPSFLQEADGPGFLSPLFLLIDRKIRKQK